MYSPSSSRSLIRSACSVVVLLGAAALGGRGAAAQQPDEALVSELARVLAAADARAFDPALFGEALRHPGRLCPRSSATPGTPTSRGAGAPSIRSPSCAWPAP